MWPPAVDATDSVLESHCFATTRQGYKQMLVWMRSFGEVRCIGIESTGTYGAGLQRYMQDAGVGVIRGNDTRQARSSAPARQGRRSGCPKRSASGLSPANARLRPKSRDGMIESLRVLKACRKTSSCSASRRTPDDCTTRSCAHPTSCARPCARSEVCDSFRTLAAWRPDLCDYRSMISAYQNHAAESLGRRYLELHDEIADLDTMIPAQCRRTRSGTRRAQLGSAMSVPRNCC